MCAPILKPTSRQHLFEHSAACKGVNAACSGELTDNIFSLTIASLEYAPKKSICSRFERSSTDSTLLALFLISLRWQQAPCDRIRHQKMGRKISSNKNRAQPLQFGGRAEAVTASFYLKYNYSVPHCSVRLPMYVCARLCVATVRGPHMARD